VSSSAGRNVVVIGAIRSESGQTAALRAAGWLGLAGAPTFAIMALLTGVLGGGQPDMLCAAMQHTSALDGMIPMYLLMSASHLAPWLKLISRWPACSGHSRNNGVAAAFSRREAPGE
jgi:hypothetical protein